MPVDEVSGNTVSGEEVARPEPKEAPEISVERGESGEPRIEIEVRDSDGENQKIITTDIFDALEFLTETGNREYGDELFDSYARADRDQARRNPARQGRAETRANPVLRPEPEAGMSPAEQADAIPATLAAEVGLVAEAAPDEGVAMSLEPSVSAANDNTPQSRAEDSAQMSRFEDTLSADDRAEQADKAERQGGGPLPDGATKKGMTREEFLKATEEFLGHDRDWYIHEWADIPTLEVLKNVPEGLARAWDALSDPEVIDNIDTPTWDKMTEDVSVMDFMTKKTPGKGGLRLKLSGGGKGGAKSKTGGPKRDKPTLGYRMLKNVRRSKAYKALKNRRVNGKPAIDTKPAPKKGLGARFQKKVAEGRETEYVGQLKRGIRRPDGKKVRKTVQIDDLRTADDGRLILVEAKAAKPDIDIPDSGHVKFGIDSKVDHMRRLIRFARENPDQVNRIEIWVNKSGTGKGVRSTTGEIYKAILQELSPADRKLFDIKYW